MLGNQQTEWLENVIPRRYRQVMNTAFALVLLVPILSAYGAGMLYGTGRWWIVAVGALAIALPFVGFMIWQDRRDWPHRVGLSPGEVLLLYPDGRQRAIDWSGIRSIHLVPEKWRHESYSSIRYHDGSLELRAFLWGSCAKRVVEVFASREGSTGYEALGEKG